MPSCCGQSSPSACQSAGSPASNVRYVVVAWARKAISYTLRVFATLRSVPGVTVIPLGRDSSLSGCGFSPSSLPRSRIFLRLYSASVGGHDRDVRSHERSESRLHARMLHADGATQFKSCYCAVASADATASLHAAAAAGAQGPARCSRCCRAPIFAWSFGRPYPAD